MNAGEDGEKPSDRNSSLEERNFDVIFVLNLIINNMFIVIQSVLFFYWMIVKQLDVYLVK